MPKSKSQIPIRNRCLFRGSFVAWFLVLGSWNFRRKIMPDAIVTEGLTKFYGAKCVVNNLTLRVPEGCVYGFLGRNGAGKSTTIKMLTGMVHPDAGSASLLGQDVATLPPEMRQRI